MLTLWNWYLTAEEPGGMVAHGVVSGHLRLPTGLSIHTSLLEKAEIKKETLVLTTASGHRYFLRPEGISDSRWEETAACLELLGIKTGYGERCLQIREEAEEAELEKLAEGELLLEAVGRNTLRAWFKAGRDKLVKLEPYIHVGMFQDSVLITDWEGGTVDFRYFPKEDWIEPYHISDGLERIKLRNVGGTDVIFGRSGREVRCRAGETTAVPAADHDREGLFSPDAVNGKGLYQSLIPEEKDEEPKA